MLHSKWDTKITVHVVKEMSCPKAISLGWKEIEIFRRHKACLRGTVIGFKESSCHRTLLFLDSARTPNENR